MMFRPLHNDYRTTLALVATLPTLAFFGSIVLYGYFSTSLPALAWPGITILAVILSMLGSLIYQHLATHFLQPLISINALMTMDVEPNSTLKPPAHHNLKGVHSLPSLPARLNTFLATQQSTARLDAEQKHRQLQTFDNQRRFTLQQKLARIEQTLDQAAKQQIRLGDNQKSDVAEQLQLSYLIDNSLRLITSFTNLLGISSATMPLKRQMRTSATGLLFYQAEMRTRMTPGITCAQPNNHTEFILRDCIDDVIALLQPLLARSGAELLPIYDEHCQHDLAGDESTLKSIIFNYLLACITATTPEPHATYLLHINLTTDYGEDEETHHLHLAPDSVHWQTTPKPTARLSQSVNSVKGEIRQDGLHIPANYSITTIRLAPAGLTAIVHGRNPSQTQGLTHRLRQLGINVLEPQSTADLCLIGLDDHQQIMSITASLPPSTDVLLLNNTRTYSRSDWLILPQPLRQSDLVTLLANKYSVAAKQQLNILVVDDDHLARQFLSTLLRQSGYNVSEATDGEQAISYATTQSVDLIFMDIHMPRMNGLEATRELRTTHGLSLPIIALTAHLLDSERAAIITAGANDILIKPLNFDLLNQHLTTWIRGNVDTESERDEASQTTPIFDTELAFTIANQQPDLAIEMLDLFMQSLDRDRAKLNQAIADNNMELMRDVVHRLNGASQFCGIPRVQAAICRLESLIKTDAANDLPIVLHQVQQELNALEQWYSQTPNPLLEFPRTSLRQLS